MQSLLNLTSVGNNIARKTLAAEIQRRPVMVEHAGQQEQHRHQQGARATKCSMSLDVPSDCLSNSHDGNNQQTNLPSGATAARATNGMQGTDTSRKHPLDVPTARTTPTKAANKETSMQQRLATETKTQAHTMTSSLRLPRTRATNPGARHEMTARTTRPKMDYPTRISPGEPKSPGHRAATNLQSDGKHHPASGNRHRWQTNSYSKLQNTLGCPV